MFDLNIFLMSCPHRFPSKFPGQWRSNHEKMISSFFFSFWSIRILIPEILFLLDWNFNIRITTINRELKLITQEIDFIDLCLLFSPCRCSDLYQVVCICACVSEHCSCLSTSKYWFLNRPWRSIYWRRQFDAPI